MEEEKEEGQGWREGCKGESKETERWRNGGKEGERKEDWS